MIFKKDLIKPPILRSHGESNHERHASWLELFYDLMFVAAFSHLAQLLEHTYSPLSFIKFTILFVPIWWAWVGQTMYLTRFDSDDLVHRFFSFLQMIALALLVVNMNEATGFALSYCAIRLILVAEYFFAGLRIPEARPLTYRYCFGFFIGILCWFGSIFVPAPWLYSLWFMGLFIDFLTSRTTGRLQLRFPPHLSHLPERFGLFTLIVLGESLFDVVTGIDKMGLHLSSGLIGICGIFIAFALWWAYFDGAKAAQTRRLNSEGQLAKYQVWLYAHLPLAIGLVAFAGGLKRTILLAPGHALSSVEAMILCGSLGITMVALHLIASTHHQHWKIKQFVFQYYFLTSLIFALGSIGHHLSGLQLVFLLALVCGLHATLALRAPAMSHEK